MNRSPARKIQLDDEDRSRSPVWAARTEGGGVELGHADAAAGDWLRRKEHGKAPAGRPGATVKL